MTLAGVAISPPKFCLNKPDTVALEVSTTNSVAVAEFRDPTREIQVVRDGTVLFWGPAVRIEIDDDRTEVQCADPRWYLTRRFFGRADRVNLLVGGDFEDGLTGWDTPVALTPVIDPTRAVQGTQSVRLTGSAEGHDSYLPQTYTHSQQYSPEGDQLTIATHVWVPSADYQGDATHGLGLFVVHNHAAGGLPNLYGDEDPQVTITEDTPKDQWVRFEVTVDFVKAGDTVEVRLYPPWGTANYDLVTLTLRESLSFVEQDMATIISGMVGYAQGLFGGFDHGKSDLGIAVDVDPTGVTLSRTFEFADHQNIDDELMVFTRRRGGVDYTFDHPTRTLVVSHPHAGTVREDLTLTWGGNVTRFRLSVDRVQKADQAVILGPGDGPDREEGGATATPAGPTLEDVTVAPDGTEVGELDRAASERLAVVTHPEVLQVTCVGLIGNLSPGDWVPVTISALAMSEEQYRVIDIAPDPANDSLVATLNLRDPITPEEAMARFPRAVDACTDGAGGVWVVASDGGVGAYNGATFHGSLPDDAIIPNAPVVAIVPHGAGGYWLVGADTGVFAYGDAPGRYGYTAMIDTEYAQGDRAIIGAEAHDPGGDDTLQLIADDGSLYLASDTP